MTSITDLVIVGGGPAGCAAAVMAASVGMRSVLIEPDALCAKLRHIAAVDNVVGGHTSGPELAAVFAQHHNAILFGNSMAALVSVLWIL